MKQPFKLAHPQVYEIIDHLYDVIWQHVMIRRHGIFFFFFESDVVASLNHHGGAFRYGRAQSGIGKASPSDGQSE